MKPLRITYLISLGILGMVLAAIIYSIPGESTKYKEVSRTELVKLDRGWVVQLDLNNPDEKSEKYNISVKVGDKDSDGQSVLIQPDSKFRYSYGAVSNRDETVSLKVYRDDDSPVLLNQEFFHNM